MEAERIAVNPGTGCAREADGRSIAASSCATV